MSSATSPHVAPNKTGRRPGAPRVVFLTDIVTPYMSAVFEALAELVDLHVVFCAERSDRGGEWRFDDLPYPHSIAAGLTIWRDDPDVINYFLSPRIFAAVARQRPDVVISAGYSVPTVYATAYVLGARRRLVIQSDGTTFSERGLGFVQRAARQLLLRVASAAVANSTGAVERYAELGVRRDRIFAGLHSTDVARFAEAARGREDAPDGVVRVLGVGRFLPRKGFDRLIRAMGLAAERGAPPMRLILAGSGPLEEELRSLADEQRVDVEFRGFVDQPDLPDVYRDADVFVFPTLDDPFGIVLLEAAAAGLPLVSSPWAGATDDLVKPGQTGFVVDPQDLDRMASKLAELAAGQDLRARLGAAAQNLAAARAPGEVAKGYLAAVDAALSRGGRAIPLLGGRR